MISQILTDATGRTLFEENADAPQNPASLTKLMTLWLTFRDLPLDRMVTVPDKAEIRRVPGKVPQSNMGLKAGMQVSVCDLVLGMIVPSGNDAATTIATLLAPDGTFVARLNDQAAQMGLAATRFVSASGLGRGTSTARDMAVLARRVHDDYPQYRALFGIESFVFGGRRYRTTNNLSRHYPGMTGLKTGTLANLHRNLAASATRQGVTAFSIVMNCPDRKTRDALTAALLDRALPPARQPARHDPSQSARDGQSRGESS